MMIDPAYVLFISSFIPAIFAAGTTWFFTKDMLITHFLNPTLKHMKIFRRRSKICLECIRNSEKYTTMSFSRLQLAGTLSFISVGLLSSAIILIIQGETLPGLSYIIYFLIPLFLSTHYVLLRRQVFSWWKNRYWRSIFVLTVLSSSAFIAVDPKVVSIFDIFFNPSPITILTFNIPKLFLKITIISIVIIYSVAKVWNHFKHPTLRNALLKELDKHLEGLTIYELIDELNSKIEEDVRKWNQEEVQLQLEKLIYQEIVNQAKSYRQIEGHRRLSQIFQRS